MNERSNDGQMVEGWLRAYPSAMPPPPASSSSLPSALLDGVHRNLYPNLIHPAAIHRPHTKGMTATIFIIIFFMRGCCNS